MSRSNRPVILCLNNFAQAGLIGLLQRRLQRETAAKEARRQELLRANAALHQVPAGLGAAENGDWNPFAEDERRPIPASLLASSVNPSLRKPHSTLNTVFDKQSKPKPRAANSNGTSRKAKADMETDGSVKKPSALERFNKGLSTKKPTGDEKKPSPPPMGRKAKAALAFAQSAMKASKADRLYSVRQLVDKGQDHPMSRSHSLPISPTLPASPSAKVRRRDSGEHGKAVQPARDARANGSASSPQASSASKLSRIKPPPIPSTARRRPVVR